MHDLRELRAFEVRVSEGSSVFDGNGRNGFGLGLIVGVCSTLIFSLYFWWGLDGVISETKDTLAQWLMAVFGVIATALSAWAVVLLKSTLNQTSIATKATIDAVQVAEKMGRIQTQAYLSFCGTEIQPFANPEGDLVAIAIRAKFKNTGISPARMTYGYCKITFLHDLQTPFQHESQRSAQHLSNLNIGASETRWHTSSIVLIADIVKEMRAGRTLVAYGIVEFTDVFEQAPRTDIFCAGIIFNIDLATLVKHQIPEHDWVSHQDFTVSLV